MSWIILILAGLMEVGFTFCLGKTTVYPVWTGIGAVGAVLVGIFFITTLILSIIGLKVLA
ncbi:MAG: hypothetical protein J1E84_07140 [Muribaculaceae bacterium]|nr:hypothetical protein [Muribaculaceae bacterium]